MVKDAIKHNTGIAPDLYFLTCEGRQLNDQRPLRDYDIENEATLRSTDDDGNPDEWADGAYHLRRMTRFGIGA
ncbi:hypothetical protein T492DRAFT_876733 [Pavlovales sp. CCMP2436]|nr:hypothetical protein T492DRAFT_876733 [Pavlovales sp. CCMP2436]